jgi:hypothetical protein
MKILAIDPGNRESGYAIIEMPEFKLIEFGKIENHNLLDLIKALPFKVTEIDIAIEMIGAYGMAVGKDVFETCVWIGRFEQALRDIKYHNINYIYRKDEKINLCGTMKAKDTNIRQALINRYAKFDFKNGKGVKANPDTFYGVSKDVWQAIAVGVTYYDLNNL